MFILMGNVLSRTGISDDLFRAAYAFLGSVRGGLALSTHGHLRPGFSAVCGSSLATAATMSKVAYPSMKRYGYSEELATATIAAGGTLKQSSIPPSIILMIYGLLCSANQHRPPVHRRRAAGPRRPRALHVRDHVGGIAPTAGSPCRRTGALARKAGLAARRVAVCAAVLPHHRRLYGAIFTATEAAGMGAGFALIIALMQRRLSWKSFREVFVETAGTSTMLYFVLFGAMLFAKLVTFRPSAKGWSTSCAAPASAPTARCSRCQCSSCSAA